MKIVKVILSPEAEEVYKYLNSNSDSKTERMILKAVNQKIELIKANPHYGNPIAKNLIPIEYKKKYGGTNLEIISFVLDIIDHPTYDKKFGYEKC